MLIAVTEKRTKQEIGMLAEDIGELSGFYEIDF